MGCNKRRRKPPGAPPAQMPVELAAWLHKMARVGFAKQEGRTEQRQESGREWQPVFEEHPCVPGAMLISFHLTAALWWRHLVEPRENVIVVSQEELNIGNFCLAQPLVYLSLVCSWGKEGRRHLPRITCQKVPRNSGLPLGKHPTSSPLRLLFLLFPPPLLFIGRGWWWWMIRCTLWRPLWVTLVALWGCMWGTRVDSRKLFVRARSVMSDSATHKVFLARILEWIAISFCRGIFLTQGSNPHLLCLPYEQTGSLPSEPTGKPENSLRSCYDSPSRMTWWLRLEWHQGRCQEEDSLGKYLEVRIDRTQCLMEGLHPRLLLPPLLCLCVMHAHNICHFLFAICASNSCEL